VFFDIPKPQTYNEPMATRYRATLKGNTLEWQTEAPKVAGELEVDVLLVEPLMSKAEQGQRMAKALQDLAEAGAFEAVDALVWQREQRQDRPLPKRDE
jgi:hypothetical protein